MRTFKFQAVVSARFREGKLAFSDVEAFKLIEV
jgi:hypothetical protein